MNSAVPYSTETTFNNRNNIMSPYPIVVVFVVVIAVLSLIASIHVRSTANRDRTCMPIDVECHYLGTVHTMQFPKTTLIICL